MWTWGVDKAAWVLVKLNAFVCATQKLAALVLTPLKLTLSGSLWVVWVMDTGYLKTVCLIFR